MTAFDSPTIETITHSDIAVRYAREGEGPLVILCHGFPGLWQSWGPQIQALAGAGYTAVALDMRGYGGSSKPQSIDDYRLDKICEDLFAVLHHFGQRSALFIGTDFGAAVLWHLARAHPDRVRAMVVMSVPFDFDYYGYMGQDRSLAPPTERFKDIAANQFLHAHHFQQPGLADSILDAQPKEFLTRLFWALSSQGKLVERMSESDPIMNYPQVLGPAEQALPWPWMSEALMDTFAESFARTGFTGALNWYRVCDQSWALNGELIDHSIDQPCLFICGKQDPVLLMSGPDALRPMQATVKQLHGIEIIDKAGHFVQMEQADEVNLRLLQFLSQITG